MTKNLKILLIVLGFIMLGGLISLALQKPELEEIIETEELELGESIVDEQFINEEFEKSVVNEQILNKQTIDDDLKEVITNKKTEENLSSSADFCVEKSYEMDCQEKCTNLGYSYGVCRSFAVSPEGFEQQAVIKETFDNVGKTKDCYVPLCPHPMVGINKNCYCFPKKN